MDNQQRMGGIPEGKLIGGSRFGLITRALGNLTHTHHTHTFSSSSSSSSSREREKRGVFSRGKRFQDDKQAGRQQQQQPGGGGQQ